MFRIVSQQIAAPIGQAKRKPQIRQIHRDTCRSVQRTTRCRLEAKSAIETAIRASTQVSTIQKIPYPKTANRTVLLSLASLVTMASAAATSSSLTKIPHWILRAKVSALPGHVTSTVTLLSCFRSVTGPTIRSLWSSIIRLNVVKVTTTTLIGLISQVASRSAQTRTSQKWIVRSEVRTSSLLRVDLVVPIISTSKTANRLTCIQMTNPWELAYISHDPARLAKSRLQAHLIRKHLLPATLVASVIAISMTPTLRRME